ncbi:MAG: cytochrome ubiquinol oxidase subunit I [Rhodanobacter sp.]
MIEFSSFHMSAPWPLIVAFHAATLLPLVAGLPPIVAIMESVYVMTEREIWRQIARFWNRLFGIALLTLAIGSFVLLVLHGVDPVRSVRQLHALPELVMTLPAAALLFAGGMVLWHRFGDWLDPRRLRHLLVTWLWMALSTLLVLGIALVYGLMDNPAGACLDSRNLQVRICDLPAALLNPAAQARFVHLLGASYLTAATMVLSVSAWYLGHRRNVQIARRSMTVAASFGLAAALSLAVLGERGGAPLLSWSFRAMVLLGVCAIALFGVAFWRASRRQLDRRGFLRLATWSLPVPWVAGALGWLVSETGRGPWLVAGLLPATTTQAGARETAIGVIACAAVAGLFVAGAVLSLRLMRLGPEGMGIWPADSNMARRY